MKKTAYKRKDISYSKLRARNKKVWNLIVQGKYSAQEIAKKTGCGIQSVYDLRYRMKKAGVEIKTVRASRGKAPSITPPKKKSPATLWQRLKALFFTGD